MKPGQLVRYSAPLKGEESIVFVVLESHDGRALVRWVNSGMPIAPIETLPASELEVIE